MIRIDDLPEAPRIFDQRGIATPENREQEQLGMLSHCRYCSGQHPTICPFIRSVEWHPSGQLARVLLEPRQQLKEAIAYPDDDATPAALEMLLEAVEKATTLKQAKTLVARVRELIVEEQPA